VVAGFLGCWSLVASQGMLFHRQVHFGRPTRFLHSNRLGAWMIARLLGHEGLEPVAVCLSLPAIEGRPRDAEDPAGLGHVAGLCGVCQHTEASLIDDLGRGHGDGLLGSVEGTTESIAAPCQGVDVQRQPSVRKG